MVIYVILSYSVAIGTFLYFIYLLFKKFRDKKSNVKYDSTVLISVFLLSFCLMIIAQVLQHSDNLLDRSSDDYTKIGPYGDLIGGIVNPAIAFVGIIAASLAFYAQYKANKQVQEQFSIQKFESQFYEMLRMHRENLNEMIIEGYQFDYSYNVSGQKEALKNTKREKLTSGKKIFVTMLTEFESIHLICKKIFYKHYVSNGSLDKLESLEGKQLIFDHSYYVFFNGITLYSKNYKRFVQSHKSGLLSEDLLYKFVTELKSMRGNHENEGVKFVPLYFVRTPLKSESLWLSFNYKPFSGHQSLLAHYYRHLFQIVKFVVKQDAALLSYSDKRDYLRILRATLSNHEQILLYYNWLSGFGSSWEIKLEKEHLKQSFNEHSNKFFTDYRMIHNIPNDLIIDEFKLETVFTGGYRDFEYESGRKESDTLFELLKIKSIRK